MKKYLLDTSFVCAFFNDKDVNNAKARIIAKGFKSSDFFVPDVVIAEIASFSKNPVLRDSILNNAFDMANIVYSFNEKNISNYVNFAENLKYSFTAIDSIILFLAKESGSELITFDKKLLKQYKSL